MKVVVSIPTGSSVTARTATGIINGIISVVKLSGKCVKYLGNALVVLFFGISEVKALSKDPIESLGVVS